MKLNNEVMWKFLGACIVTVWVVEIYKINISGNLFKIISHNILFYLTLNLPHWFHKVLYWKISVWFSSNFEFQLHINWRPVNKYNFVHRTIFLISILLNKIEFTLHTIVNEWELSREPVPMNFRDCTTKNICQENPKPDHIINQHECSQNNKH